MPILISNKYYLTFLYTNRLRDFNRNTFIIQITRFILSIIDARCMEFTYRQFLI